MKWHRKRGTLTGQVRAWMREGKWNETAKWNWHHEELDIMQIDLSNVWGNKKELEKKKGSGATTSEKGADKRNSRNGRGKREGSQG